jgi:hypothetical protein
MFYFIILEISIFYLSNKVEKKFKYRLINYYLFILNKYFFL